MEQAKFEKLNYQLNQNKNFPKPTRWGVDDMDKLNYMLTIENRNSLLGDRIKDIKNANDYYYVYGVYEYPTDYQIHLRSSNKTIEDEVLILLRNRKEVKDKGVMYKYYDMYDNNKPTNRVGMMKEALQNTKTMIIAIENILEKK
jgi:hypothetical protein